MKILIFSEEYKKITKGMFAVWLNHSIEIAKDHQLEILLNREHWAFEEIPSSLLKKQNVFLKKLPFLMPITLVRYIFPSLDNQFKWRAIKSIIGRFFNILLSPFIILYFFFYFSNNKVDAIYSHNGGWPAGQLCRWILIGAKLAKIKNRVIIIHNYPAKEKYSFLIPVMYPLRSIQNWLIDFSATSIVSVSDSVKEILQPNFSSTVVRIYNGIICNEFSYSLEKVIWEHNDLVVGFVGALFPLKGPHVLLDAFKLIPDKCELALLGPADPEYLKMLRKKAQQCSNKVSFLGFHSNVDSFLEQIDLLVVPSVAFESFGMVILEAMKHHKAVICSDFGGMKEIVVDGVTGLVVPVNDSRALASAISKLIIDKKLRNEMGEAGYHRLVKDFSTEKMAKQYFDLIRL